MLDYTTTQRNRDEALKWFRIAHKMRRIQVALRRGRYMEAARHSQDLRRLKAEMARKEAA